MKIQNFIRICLITSSLAFVATTEAARELNYTCSDSEGAAGIAIEFVGGYRDRCDLVSQFNIYSCTGSSGSYVNTVRVRQRIGNCNDV
jgi:hypothetical protein